MKKEIRLHGRGGQGAVMAAAMLATAFVNEGKYATAFPMFGVERRGAPVTSFVRFGDEVVREKTQIYYPDCLIVIDPAQVKSPPIYSGLKPGGIMTLNSPEPIKESPHENVRLVGMVDATGIALEEIGVPIGNSCMLGAFAGTTQWLSLDSVLAALEKFFKGERLKRNIRSAERGFNEITVTQW